MLQMSVFKHTTSASSSSTAQGVDTEPSKPSPITTEDDDGGNLQRKSVGNNNNSSINHSNAKASSSNEYNSTNNSNISISSSNTSSSGGSGENNSRNVQDKENINIKQTNSNNNVSFDVNSNNSNNNRQEIFSIDFSALSKSKQELIDLGYNIFEETGLVKDLDVNKETVYSYLEAVKESYRDNPFHSFKHAITVTQMIFIIFIKAKLLNILTPIEKLSLIIASICHDLDHPALSNRFQINMKSSLAQQYNNKSVLENHHLAVCIRILLEENGQNLLRKLSDQEREQLYEKIKILILATDMENHFNYKKQFDDILSSFSWENTQHRDLLLIMLLKSADISNELRSFEISNEWAHALMQEFFNQSDLEKENNLPLTPFMEREKVILNTTQISFIDKFLLPSYNSLQTVLPPLEDFITRINENRLLWEQSTN
ncbi:hypothetical protein CYY_005396 [Polysphondylium violaceum]|uniref:Phosphodiesterase n=1 Tax=Polysphondylium violaceum TaxID=133409 RepID=A0A8J4PTL4_9MYCE|nr:hypothetical protein CYY_005396 [Polysphondylium violaceum]